jgi:hypothetical protein
MGTQLTDPSIPYLSPSGVNLQDYVTYVRKIPSGGTQDFKITLADIYANTKYSVVENKQQLRTLNPAAANERCDCLGGKAAFDNQGGTYVTRQSTDQDNDGDRIRPSDFKGFVWFKWQL